MLSRNVGNANVANSTPLRASPCSRELDDFSALPCGARLQSYTIDAILGHGGFGITYKAREDITNRAVAIKEYLPTALAVRDQDGAAVRPQSEGAARDFEWGLECFRDEAKVLIGFRHPNIVPVLSYFEANRTGYLVMEFQEGTSLAEVLNDTPAMSEPQLLQVVVPLIDGVEEVHRRGFLHRDIKPENIFIRRDGTPVLLDFGAARRALGERSKKFTTVLTEGYAPLEQYSEDGNQGPWGDVYALGAVMFECLTGRPPVEAPRRARAKLLGLADPLAPDFATVRDVVSADVAYAIEAALSVVDKERPQTIGAFRELLMSTKPATVPVSAAALPAPSAPPAITLIPDQARRRDAMRDPLRRQRAVRRRPRRAPRVMAFAMLVVAAVTGAAVYFGAPIVWPANGLRAAGIASARPAVLARPARESERQAQGARLFPANACRPAQVPDALSSDARAGAEDKDLKERRSQALLDHQRRQIERFEEERRQALAAFRAAEAERQRAAEAHRKDEPGTKGPADLRPPS